MTDAHIPAAPAARQEVAMADAGCADVVSFGGDPELAPAHSRAALVAHSASCADCSTYVSQMGATRDLLGRAGRRRRREAQAAAAASSAEPAAGTDPGVLRDALLERAELLDPDNAEDLTQRTLEVGLALQQRDDRRRGIAELTTIMHTLGDAQARLDGRTAPAVDVTAAARARDDSLEDLDVDADEAELFYPNHYPSDAGIDGWVDSPHRWPGGAGIPSPEEVDETGEVYDVLDKALTELPEPLGDLVALVDLQGYPLAGSAQALGLDQTSAAAVLARARNHVRGRLDAYLTGNPGAGAAPRS